MVLAFVPLSDHYCWEPSNWSQYQEYDLSPFRHQSQSIGHRAIRYLIIIQNDLSPFRHQSQSIGHRAIRYLIIIQNDLSPFRHQSQSIGHGAIRYLIIIQYDLSPFRHQSQSMVLALLLNSRPRKISTSASFIIFINSRGQVGLHDHLYPTNSNYYVNHISSIASVGVSLKEDFLSQPSSIISKTITWED